jgi:hypothetical protein
MGVLQGVRWMMMMLKINWCWIVKTTPQVPKDFNGSIQTALTLEHLLR